MHTVCHAISSAWFHCHNNWNDWITNFLVIKFYPAFCYLRMSKRNKNAFHSKTDKPWGHTDANNLSITRSLRWWSCQWSETTSLNCGQQRAYCSTPRWYTSMENSGGMMSTEDNSWLVHQNSLAVLLAESSSSKQEEQFTGLLVSDFFKCRKMLRHAASGFTSLRRKACYGFLSPLKSIALAGSEHANLGFNGKHTDHQLIRISAVQDSTDLDLCLYLNLETAGEAKNKIRWHYLVPPSPRSQMAAHASCIKVVSRNLSLRSSDLLIC
jgi:hypothetical protein